MALKGRGTHTDEGRCADVISSEPAPAAARRTPTPQQTTPKRMKIAINVAHYHVTDSVT